MGSYGVVDARERCGDGGGLTIRYRYFIHNATLIYTHRSYYGRGRLTDASTAVGKLIL